MYKTPATRKQMIDFKRRVYEEFGYIVKIRTMNFTDLARCSTTFATVIGSTQEINTNILQARALAGEHNIILNFPIIYKEY